MKRESSYYPFLAFFILYFFFNNLFLKEGLLYTTLLVPVFLYWLYKKGQVAGMLKWTLLLLFPLPFQLLNGVDPGSYFISSLLVLSAWIFLFTALEAIRSTRDSLEEIFLTSLKVNSVLVLIALCILPFSGLREFMWDTIPMTRNLYAIPRLKLLAYEPSHYGLLLAPVFLYFILKILTGKSGHPLILAAGIGVPLLLTFSFGIIGAMIPAILISALAHLRNISVNARRMLIYSVFFLIIVTGCLWILWPDNPFFIRAGNIITGADSSTKGRLVHSFMFAKDLILQHNAWMGVGPGQIKILAHDLIVSFYKYTGEYAEIVRIPNSMGEMLATYGIYGFILKIFFEVFFFVRLKIYRNLYSLGLFIFIFIYQFTGSFLVNAAEIGIWAIVFAGRFPLFQGDSLRKEEG